MEHVAIKQGYLTTKMSQGAETPRKQVNAWGLKKRLPISVKYEFVNVQFDLATFVGSFFIRSAYCSPHRVDYQFDGCRIEEVACFGRGSVCKNVFVMSKKLKRFLQNDPNASASLPVWIVRYCFVVSLLRKKVAVDRMLNDVEKVLPSTYFAIVMEENTEFHGNFPRRQYAKKMHSIESIPEFESYFFCGR